MGKTIKYYNLALKTGSQDDIETEFTFASANRVEFESVATNAMLLVESFQQAQFITMPD
jgi:hypothetical protein